MRPKPVRKFDEHGRFLKTSEKILDYATRQQVRVEVEAGVKDGELKTSIYRRLAAKHLRECQNHRTRGERSMKRFFPSQPVKFSIAGQRARYSTAKSFAGVAVSTTWFEDQSGLPARPVRVERLELDVEGACFAPKVAA